MISGVDHAVGAAWALRRFPLLLGGDCPVLIGALGAAGRAAFGDIGLLFVDGHEDAWPPKTSPTGEAADTELGLVLRLFDDDLDPDCAAYCPACAPPTWSRSAPATPASWPARAWRAAGPGGGADPPGRDHRGGTGGRRRGTARAVVAAHRPRRARHRRLRRGGLPAARRADLAAAERGDVRGAGRGRLRGLVGLHLQPGPGPGPPRCRRRRSATWRRRSPLAGPPG